MSDNIADRIVQQCIDDHHAISKLVADLPPEDGTVVEKVRGMKAIIDKLPKDAEGNRVGPNTELYFIDPTGHIQTCKTYRSWEKRYHQHSAGPYPCYEPEQSCYSTESAARAAAEKAVGDG